MKSRLRTAMMSFLPHSVGQIKLQGWPRVIEGWKNRPPFWGQYRSGRKLAFFPLAIYHRCYTYLKNKHFQNIGFISYVFTYTFAEFVYQFCVNFHIESEFCCFKKIGLRKLEETLIGQKLYYFVFLNLIKNNLTK